jgi:hypothetical protein
MLRRAGSWRETPVVVEDYNFAAGGRSGMKQTRIDTGSWTQKGTNARESIGKAWSKFFHTAGVTGRQADSPYFVSAVRETQKWVTFFHFMFIKVFFRLAFVYLFSCFFVWLQVKELHPPLDGILMVSILI